MNFSDLRKTLRDRLLTITDQVQDIFIHPEETAEMNVNFPYITFVFGESTVDLRKVMQSISIIGIVKGEFNDIPEKVDALKDEIHNALYNQEPKIKINSIDMTNLFKPFGLDAGLFPPYGGVRFECEIPYVIERQA